MSKPPRRFSQRLQSKNEQENKENKGKKPMVVKKRRTYHKSAKKVTSERVLVEIPIENVDENRENQSAVAPVESLIDYFFGNSFQVNFKIVGGKLVVEGEDVAQKIKQKFKMMEKLAHLVGCGLDCHFRFLDDRFALLMLVRGFPRVVFGASCTVVPNINNMTEHATLAHLVEHSQNTFFDSILLLLPRNMHTVREMLKSSLENGEEDSVVLWFYDFLDSIRNNVFRYISTVPSAWITDDHSPRNDENVDLEALRNVIQACGDNHLINTELRNPGYFEEWKARWKQSQPFAQQMQLRFEQL